MLLFYFTEYSPSILLVSCTSPLGRGARVLGQPGSWPVMSHLACYAAVWLKIESTEEATSVVGRRGEQLPAPARRPVPGEHPLSEARDPPAHVAGKRSFC